MTGPTRIALIGVGGMRIADYHAQAFLQTGRAELAAICDVQRQALDAFAERFGVPPGRRYTEHHAMLAAARPDIVLVCTNETLHARLTIDAAEYRPRAILCEKPMAMNLGEADAMLAACQRNGVLLVVGHQRRYRPQYARARELLQGGGIGELEHILVMGHPRSALMVDGTHAVDLVRFYTGDARAQWVVGQVDARSRRSGWGHALEDAALGLVCFEGGVRAWITLGGGGATPTGEGLGRQVTGRNYHRLLLHGTRGRIEIAGDAGEEGQPRFCASLPAPRRRPWTWGPAPGTADCPRRQSFCRHWRTDTRTPWTGTAPGRPWRS